MADRNEELNKLINASGFLLQLALENEINHLKKSDLSVTREHPWKSSIADKDGFIDLIVSTGMMRFVIECKRPRDGVWVFLVQNNAQNIIEKSRSLWSSSKINAPSTSGINDFYFTPNSYESDVCIIRGQNDQDKPLLERIASQVLLSQDCLIIEELGFVERHRFPTQLIYVPVIVTAAKLFICKVDPSKIDINSGTLSDATFEEVPLVRFRKSLVSDLSIGADPFDLHGSNRDRERTVFVINSNHFAAVLNQWRIDAFSNNGRPPWD